VENGGTPGRIIDELFGTYRKTPSTTRDGAPAPTKEHAIDRGLRNMKWLVSVAFVVVFSLIMCLFHPVHVVARLFGKRFHRVTLNWMNEAIILAIRFVGTARIHRPPPGSGLIPEDRPLIFVSNHQGMYDIPFLMRLVPMNTPVGFIAKRELSRGLPSVSFSLRRLDSALIDRSDPEQAVDAITELGQRMTRERGIAVIFPEGTRARDGKMKPFKKSGFLALLKSMPDAIVVPIAIDGCWKFLEKKLWPVPLNVSISISILAPITRTGISDEEVINRSEQVIRAALDNRAP
jgi:1-acyl-sn-glycerol-3-phosphate acyltransferase